MAKAQLNKIASTREMILSVLIILGIIIAFFQYVYPYYQKDIKTLKKKIVTINKDIKKLNRQTKKLELVVKDRELEQLKKFRQEEANKNRKKSSDIKIQILERDRKPDFADMSAFIRHITAPGYLEGLTIDSLSDNPTSEQAGYKSTPFNIKSHGAASVMTKFLKKLDQLNALVSVDSVNLSVDSQTQGVMLLDIRATFYELEGDE